MRRIRIGIIGAGALTEWALLPALSGPDATLPPDSGHWRGRRLGAQAEIHYQPAATPEILALCDDDEARARRVGEAARVRAIYGGWREMLQEAPLDAVLCTAGPDTAAEVALALRGSAQPCHLWVDGPPAQTAQAVVDLEKLLDAAPNLRLWPARPLRVAAAHRAARRLLDENAVGAVSALSLRWGAGLFRPNSAEANGRYKALTADQIRSQNSSYAALDLLLSLAAPPGDAARGGLAAPVAVCGSQRQGAAVLWLHFADGAAANLLFAPAEHYGAALPRIEIVGADGRSLVCEGARRLWRHQPGEPSQMTEPPGAAAQISSANLLGVSEDLKAFLNFCAQDEPRAARRGVLEGPVRVLRVLEAAAESLQTGRVVEIEPSARGTAWDSDGLPVPEAPSNATLPLDWRPE